MATVGTTRTLTEEEGALLREEEEYAKRMKEAKTEEEKRRLEIEWSRRRADAQEKIWLEKAASTVTSPVDAVTADSLASQRDELYQNTIDLLSDYAKNSSAFKYTPTNPEYESQAEALRQQILNDEFHYDPSADPTAEAIRREYINGGKLAMRDTLGTASAATGGLASSYAQQAGQQAYGSYMKNYATQVLPTLKEMAEAQHRRETNDVLQKLGILEGAMEGDYNRQYNEWTANETARSNALQNELNILNARGEKIDSQLAEIEAKNTAEYNEAKALDEKARSEFNGFLEDYKADGDLGAFFDKFIPYVTYYGIDEEQRKDLLIGAGIPYDEYEKRVRKGSEDAISGGSASEGSTQPTFGSVMSDTSDYIDKNLDPLYRFFGIK